MTRIIVDCSAVAAWCFEDERSSAGDELFGRVAREGCLVPAHWRLEVASMLLIARKRGRITRDRLGAKLDELRSLDVRVDIGASSLPSWARVIELAEAEGLTSYDAAYLELALREGCSLATKDAELIAACRRRGVPVLLV